MPRLLSLESDQIKRGDHGIGTGNAEPGEYDDNFDFEWNKCGVSNDNGIVIKLAPKTDGGIFESGSQMAKMYAHY